MASMAPGANNEFNHYGTVVTVGYSADSVSMLNKISDWNKSSLKNVVDLASIIPDMIVTQHGSVVSMGNDSISQLMTHALPVAKVS